VERAGHLVPVPAGVVLVADRRGVGDGARAGGDLQRPVTIGDDLGGTPPRQADSGGIRPRGHLELVPQAVARARIDQVDAVA